MNKALGFSTGRSGFTLLEVLISFSILATLLTVVIQSQSETIFFLEKTSKLERVQKEVINHLLAIERGATEVEESNGIFQEEHPLEGDQWFLSTNSKLINNMIPIEEIQYRIIWKIDKKEHSYSAVLLR